ncbi:DUF2142 domain-containing protein [Sphingobium sp. AN641]|uniref:DUF2142 domain-containing protein n=1 Tax=Sphingobium sp. AN641 TaxID=3133443 RepID=UPI0030C331FE
MYSDTASLTHVERWLFTLVVAATLLFTLITPPFQAPDENQHYMKALLLSEGGVLTQTQGPMIGAQLPRAATDLHDVDFPTETPGAIQLYSLDMLRRAWSADAARPGRRFADFPNVANYAPTLYAPGAAGLVIGDAIGLPRLGAFYTGRMVNALVALGLILLALRLLPFGRMALLGVALLPTAVYQTGSLSPDAVINSVGFLGLALALRIGHAPPRPARTAALFLVAPLLALAKGVYLPLMAAGLRWPRRGERGPGLILGAMAAGAIVFIGWMSYSGGTPALYHIISRKTGENVMTAPLADQLGYILGDPAGFARILLSSIVERAPVYALQIVGRLGWNAILLPLLAYPLAALMLAGALLSGSGTRFSFGQRLWWLAVAIGTALLVETAMYLTGTPLAADYVQGTQGRYFLPLMPLALMALMPAWGMRAAPRILSVVAPLLLVVALGTAIDSFWVHGFVTSDGMPPHDRPIDALLLPSPRW